MTRRCSHCSNNGHNSRTCPSRGGLKLFGVRLTDGLIKKSASMGNLSSPHLIASSSWPNPGSPSSDPLRDSTPNAEGYVSDDPADASCSSSCRAERKKGIPWTEEEHRLFLVGLHKLGKGDWRGIARNFVVSRTPTQVASHAQKYFIRQSNSTRRKRRTSLFDMVTDMNYAGKGEIDIHAKIVVEDFLRRDDFHGAIVWQFEHDYITRGDLLDVLKANHPINDQVIRCFNTLLKHRELRTMEAIGCLYVSPWVYVQIMACVKYNVDLLLSHLNKEELVKSKYIFIPICTSFHWQLLVVDLIGKSFKAKYFRGFLTRKGTFLDVQSWPINFLLNCPMQGNGYDCGIFVMLYTEFLSRGVEFSFSQADIPFYRGNTAAAILRGEIQPVGINHPL